MTTESNSQVFRFLRPNSLSTLRQKLFSLSGILVGWGLLAGAAAIFFVERIPNFRRDFFSKLPLDRYAEYRVVSESEEGKDQEQDS